MGEAEGVMPPISSRVIIVGQSCSGKSTLGARLAGLIGCDFTDLDALFWKPGWQPSPDDEFQGKLRDLAAGDAWVSAGQYHRHTSITLWPRAGTIIWLDLPLPLLVQRIIRRSWRRSRSKELLWGTNHEKFLPQFRVWEDESLIGYALRHRREIHDRYLGAMADSRWAHIRFVRLRSTAEVETFVASLEAAALQSAATTAS